MTTLLLITILNMFVGSGGRVSGNIVDSRTSIPLKGVNIICSDPRYSTTSNENGLFEIMNVDDGSYTFIISYLGYEVKKINVDIAGNEVNFNVNLNPTSIELGEVLIVSLKNYQLQKTAALPLEVINSKKIEIKSAVSVPDLLKQQSGLALSRDGIWGTNISIRGLSRSNIITLIDGNRIETSTDIAAGLSLYNLSDIERIEVIKGAASSLYGTGALGGVVNIISKSPSYQEKYISSGQYSTEYNSVNKGYGSSLALSASNNFFRMKLSMGGRNADNTKTPIGEMKNSQFEDLAFGGLLGFKLAEKHDVVFNYQLFNGFNIGIPGASSLFPTNAIVNYKFVQRDMYSVKYNWKNVTRNLTNISLKYFNQNIRRDVENIPNTPTITNAAGVKTTVLKILPTGKHYVQGLQLQSDWLLHQNNFLIAGFDFWLRNIDSRRERHLSVVLPTSTVYKVIGERPLPESNFNSAGVFAQDEFSLFNKNLSVTIGGRFDLINISNKETLQPVYEINNGVINYTPTGQKVTWNESKATNSSWSINTGFLYKITSNIDATLNIARSFRSPSLEERYQYIDQGSNTPLRVGNPELKPEHGFFSDFGIRIWQSSLSLRGNIFVNLLNDLVSEKDGMFDNRPAKIKTNLGKARLYGFDIDVESELSQSIILYTVLSYVYGEYSETTVTGEIKSPLPQIPPLNGRLGMRYTFGEFVTSDLTAIYFTKQNKIVSGEMTTPGYATFDFSVSTKSFPVNFLHLRLITGIENVLNKSYRNHLSTNRGFINIEPGRNIFVKLYTSW
jgi:outer membrane receptor protein involved in Fe transport